MGDLESKVNKLRTDTRRLNNIASKMSNLSAGVSFSYYEQELIRRIFKSVLSQIKSVDDYNTALGIISKTDWLDNER